MILLQLEAMKLCGMQANIQVEYTSAGLKQKDLLMLREWFW
jgi:hypothetical protein